jgi:heme-degrading monooxygenase HmoA
MYINISRYAGAAGKIGEAAPKVQQGFVPMLKGQNGFHGYAAFGSEQGDVVAITIWENADALTNSRDSIRAWVQNNLQGFDEPTERFHGEVGPHAIVAPQSGGQDQSLYCMVRKSEDVPTDGSQRQNVEEMLATAQKSPGFRGAYFVRSHDNPARGAAVLFCDTREQGTAVHEETMAISRRNQPNLTLRVAASGKTAVLAMA